MANIYAMSDTWNDGATTFTSIKMDVTDTASASDSLLMDLQVGGSSKFSVNKNGYAFVSPGIGATNQHGINFIGRSVGISAPNATTLRFGRDNSADMIVTYTLGSEKFVLKSAMSFGWAVLGADALNDLQLHRDAAGTLAQRTGTNAQAFNLYNTYTDASNYERGFMKWNSNVLEIGTEGAGTGSARAVTIKSNGNLTLESLGQRIMYAEFLGQDTLNFGSSTTNLDLFIFGNGGNVVFSTDADQDGLGFFGATALPQPTTAITASSFVANTSGISDDTATFGGYTIGQVVAALKQVGLLA